MTNQMTTTNLDTIQQAYNEQVSNYSDIYDSLCFRFPEIEEQYSLHKTNLKMLNMSIEQYLYNYLGVKKDDTFIKVTRNNYPYALPEGYKHDVIWCSDNLANPYLINNIAIAYLEKEDFYLWQAPESSRSVKGIQHFHLIYKI